jgi:hypothetical protein
VNEYYVDGAILMNEDYDRAKKNGINYQNAFKRFYDYGWSKEDAISVPVGARKVYKREKAFKKAKKEAEAKGIGVSVDKNIFWERVKKLGWDDMKAISTPIKNRGRNAKLYETLAKNGISYNTYRIRVGNYGWSKERAMTEPVHTQYRRRSMQ